MNPTFDPTAFVQRALRTHNDPESHVDHDVNTFHPSAMAKCPRQCAISKLGLDPPDDRLLGIFRTGTLIHEWLEQALESHPDIRAEIPIERHIVDAQQYMETKVGGIVIEGTADVYDPVDNAVIDWKSRGGWYKFDPPDERHLRQLAVYVNALGADYGRVVYLSKKDLSVRPYPEDGYLDASDLREHYNAAMETATTVADWLYECPMEIEDITRADIPFDPCGCFICEQEVMDELTEAVEE